MPILSKAQLFKVLICGIFFMIFKIIIISLYTHICVFIIIKNLKVIIIKTRRFAKLYKYLNKFISNK